MSSKKEDEIHSANFLAQLKKLDCSQASIEQLSFWCQFHAKKASVLTPIWTESLRNSSNNQNVLAHVYLASDVIQNSRKKNKGEEWMKSWKSVMENSVKFVWGEVQKRSEDTREREENDGRVGGEESVRVEGKTENVDCKQ